jgi:hypothetical protein
MIEIPVSTINRYIDQYISGAKGHCLLQRRKKFLRWMRVKTRNEMKIEIRKRQIEKRKKERKTEEAKSN